MTLYREMTDAGIPTDNHESDLYVLSTPEAREILRRWPTNAANARTFVSQVDKQTWIAIPFAYDPWWKAREVPQVVATVCRCEYCRR